MNTTIEFGSLKHGCYDMYSDKDILLLHDGHSVNIQKYRLKSLGYSVTVLSQAKASYLASSGSLFLRHVAFEGRVKEGDSKNLIALKRSWCSANNYDFEIESNIELLKVLEKVPKNQSGHIVANDILICSIRNILIRKLANKGIYSFSWNDLAVQGVYHGFLKRNHIKPIFFSRRAKNAYRMNLFPEVSHELLNELLDITHMFIDPKRIISYASHSEILNHPDLLKDGSYEQLRAIELLCSNYDFNKNLEYLRCLTKDPSYFLHRALTKKSS